MTAPAALRTTAHWQLDQYERHQRTCRALLTEQCETCMGHLLTAIRADQQAQAEERGAQ